MAMTAWSAKVWTRAICFSVKGRTSVRRTLIDADGDALSHQRNVSATVTELRAVARLLEPIGVGLEIRHVDGPASRTARPFAVPGMRASEKSPITPKRIGP